MAGVSVGTVSHVLSGSVPVSEVLQQRVRDAIEALDYHPNHIARSLKTSRTHTLGIVVPDMTIPFFPQVIRGAEAAAREHRYAIVAVNSDDDGARQNEMLTLMRAQRVDGILLAITSGHSSTSHISRIVASGIPLVCVDRIPDDLTIDSVAVDDCAAAYLGVAHLAAEGHRRIALLTGPLQFRNERERLAGYRNALEHAGIPFDSSLVWESNFRIADVAALCAEHLSKRPLPHALFSTNGVSAMGFLKSTRTLSLDVPRDLAFATFDELTVEDVFRPSISTVAQPAYEIGFQAAEILLNRIEQPASHAPRFSIRLPATLHVRESSAASHR